MNAQHTTKVIGSRAGEAIGIIVVQSAGIAVGAAIGAFIGVAMNDMATGVTWGVTTGAVIGSPLLRRFQTTDTNAT